jgi:hypothetical protein
MSQAGIISTSASVPSNVPTTFATDSGNAVPAANVITFTTNDSTVNFDNGITNSGAGSTVTHTLTNRGTGAVSTTDATLTTIFTLPAGATPGVYYVYGNVQAYNASTPAGASFSFSGGFRTTGAALTELGTEYHDDFKESALNPALPATPADVSITASGNDILLQVQGVSGLSLNWNSLLEYRFVS